MFSRALSVQFIEIPDSCIVNCRQFEIATDQMIYDNIEDHWPSWHHPHVVVMHGGNEET